MEVNTLKLSKGTKFPAINIQINVGFKKNNRTGFGANRQNAEILGYFIQRKDNFSNTFSNSVSARVINVIKKNLGRKVNASRKVIEDTINKALLTDKTGQKSYRVAANKHFKKEPPYVYYGGKKYRRQYKGRVSKQLDKNIYIYTEVHV